jgi:serine/threonine-protein kinase
VIPGLARFGETVELWEPASVLSRIAARGVGAGPPLANRATGRNSSLLPIVGYPAVARGGAAERVDVKVCTICKAKWRGSSTVCPLDGGALVELADPMIGQALAERYVIEARIGAGGMGVVYRARDIDARRDVAVKVLAPELCADPTNRQRFLREAQAANRLRHPHVIEIDASGETDDGLVYLVMEYLHGEPLSRVIARGPLPPLRAAHVTLQIASALALAHELEVVHRDIKPDNVFLLDRGGSDHVKLLDFGLARVKGERRLTANGAVLGTPEYMAPEQARGLTLTGRADLYAVGCVLYEMLTGQPPFVGSTTDLVIAHVRETPTPPSQHIGPLPMGLEAVVLSLLAKEPLLRPDPRQLQHALGRVLADAAG